MVVIPMMSMVLVVVAMPSYLMYVPFLPVMVTMWRDLGSDLWIFLSLAV